MTLPLPSSVHYLATWLAEPETSQAKPRAAPQAPPVENIQEVRMSSIEYQLGEIRAELRGISQRLDEGSRRHGELDQSDEDIKARVAALELIEAKRGGVLAAIAAFASVVGGVVALGIEIVLKKVLT